MEMSNIAYLSITPLYIALLGILFLPFTLRVGLYRVKNDISIGDGQDEELIKRNRGQGNFIETVPLAVILILLMELLGASGSWLHALGVLLVGGRLLHYLGITGLGPSLCRPIGMFATLSIYLVSPAWILINFIV
ncbi:MAG: MAPEG family protein [Gammaproteobacteria bacterium]|jgi:uncharacterized membrane protein YecN with MAPEG domain|nr:MAPEG family protein [Gammaproteobacteria bacterium]MDG2337672.1 MAPEG family protein [Gammaproteobacteria bacterium]